MASNSVRKKVDEYFLDVVFDGIIQSSDRAKLVVELLKYIVYQRQQIPLPYELIKRDNSLDDSVTDVTTDNKKTGHKSRQFYKTRQQMKKRQAAVNALEEIFRIIEKVFVDAHPINEVAILLGSTIVSPKEVLVIRFPIKFYDGPMLAYKNCVHTLFQRLVASDFMREAKLHKCSKLHVLIHATRDFACDYLHCHPSYKPPDRGQRFVLNFDYTGTIAPAELSNMDIQADISGIEPFEELESSQTSTPVNLQSESSHRHWSCDGDESDIESNFIWYRIPIIMIGYRDQTNKTSASQNIWAS